MGRRPLGPDGSWGVSVLCSSRVLTQQRPLRHHWKEMHWLPSGRLPAAFQPATSDFQCLPHALESGDRLKWECQGGLVVSPWWLRPMQTGCFMAIIKWIKIIKIPSSKEDTLFFFMYSSEALDYYSHQSCVTLIECTFIGEQHGSAHGLPVLVHNFVWTVVLAASESFKELLEELMDGCFSRLRNKSSSFVMSTTKDAGSLSCIVWPSYALAFWHDIANSISRECQQYHISPS